MRILRRPLFVDDLSAAYAYLADRNQVAADRLLDELEVAVHLIAVFPEIGRRRDEVRPGVRSFRLRGFPHIVFYRQDAQSIVLLRVLHGVRDIRPGLTMG